MSAPKIEDDSYILFSPVASDASDSESIDDVNDSILSTDVAISNLSYQNEVLTQSFSGPDSPDRTSLSFSPVQMSEDENFPDGPRQKPFEEGEVDFDANVSGNIGPGDSQIQSKENMDDLDENSNSSVGSDECSVTGKKQRRCSVDAATQSSSQNSHSLEVSSDEEAEASIRKVTTAEAYVYVKVICETLKEHPLERVLRCVSRDTWDCDISSINLYRTIMEQNCGKVPKNRPGSFMKKYFKKHCRVFPVMFREEIKSNFGDNVADKFQQLVKVHSKKRRGALPSSQSLSQTFESSSSSSNVVVSQSIQEFDADDERPLTPSNKRIIDECEAYSYLKAISKLLETMCLPDVLAIVKRADWSKTHLGVNLHQLILKEVDVPKDRLASSMKIFFEKNSRGKRDGKKPGFLALYRTLLDREFGSAVVQKLERLLDMYNNKTRIPKKSNPAEGFRITGGEQKITPTKLKFEASLAEVEEKTNNPASPVARRDGDEVVVIEYKDTYNKL